VFSLLKLFLPGLKTCPECGATNIAGYSSHCMNCGARIRNRNPLLRLFITVVAVAIVLGVLWWNWKH
jgi:hypothetical protein